MKDLDEGDVQNQKQVHTAIKFEFIMDDLVINLFTGGSKMVMTTDTDIKN